MSTSSVARLRISAIFLCGSLALGFSGRALLGDAGDDQPKPVDAPVPSRDSGLLGLIYRQLAPLHANIRILRDPLPLPQLLKPPYQLPASFDFLQSVPTSDDVFLATTNRKIRPSLQKIAEQMKIGKIELSKAEQADFDAAVRLLLRNEQPTASYKAYLAYQRDTAEIDRKLKDQSLPPAQRRILATQRDSLQSDWRERPDWIQVERAVRTMKTYDFTSEANMLAQWKKDITASQSKESGVEWETLSGRDGWRTISFSTTTDTILRLTGVALTNREKTEKTIALTPGDLVITIIYKQSKVAHSELSSDFLQSRLWSAGDLTISNGVGGKNTDNELVPRVVDDIFIYRQLDLLFSKTAWAKVADFLADNDNVSIGGIGFSTSLGYTLPNLISYSRPSVFAASIRQLPKSPDPDPRLVVKE